MAFKLKAWKNEPDKTTPISAESLNDLEERLSKYVNAIRGEVSATGVLVSGEGFTCEKTAKGKYTVKLKEELTTNAIVQLTSQSGNLVRLEAQPTKKEFKVGCYLINTTPLVEDFAFQFILLSS